MRAVVLLAVVALLSGVLAHRLSNPHAHRHRILMRGVQSGDDPASHESALTADALGAMSAARRHFVVHGAYSTRRQMSELVGVAESDVEYVPHHSWLVYASPAALQRALADSAARGLSLSVYAPTFEAHLAAVYIDALAVDGDSVASDAVLAARLAPVQVDLAREATGSLLSRWRQQLPSVRVEAISARRLRLTADAANAEYNPLAVAVWAAQQPVTRFVQPYAGTARVSNVNARPVVQSGASDRFPLDVAGLDGSGQIIGLGDTGVDWNNCFFVDQTASMPLNIPLPETDPQNRKFVIYYTLDSDSVDASGHGTHVAGTICGVLPSNRDAQELAELNPYQGLAQGARLVFLDLSVGTEGLITVPTNLTTEYFPNMYTNGARIGLSAWELPARNFYDSTAYDVDLFSAQNPDFLAIFPSGNGGAAGAASLSSIAAAKNGLTVGASLSSTQASIDAINTAAYQALYESYHERLCAAVNASDDPLWNDPAFCEGTQNAPPPCYSASQQALFCSNFQTGPDDCCSFPGYLPIRCCYSYNVQRIQTSPAQYGPQLIASYSAHGPTFDGRIKPDVVSVADPIVSAASDGESSSDGNVNCGLPDSLTPAITRFPTAGTSSAAATATASAALIRQYFQQGRDVSMGNFTPSASLVKALLIHGAQAIAGSSGISTALATNLYYPLPGSAASTEPSMFSGFGRIQLNASLQFPTSPFTSVVVDSALSPKLSTGDVERYCFSVAANNQPLIITLVWTDPPSSPTAEILLVNNLDLLLVDSTGESYRANNGGEYDALNNVERIVVPVPRLGTYQLFVQGTNVPVPPQAYSLVFSASLFTAGQLPSNASTCPTVCAENCYGIGDCVSSTGICQCPTGRTGVDCTQSLCADNCNNRGICLGSGVCQCTPAWTGTSCQAASEGRGSTATTGPVVITKKSNTGIPVGLFVGMMIVTFLIGAICAFFIGTGAGLLIAERMRSKRKQETLRMLEQG